jgi:hypothetical protein
MKGCLGCLGALLVLGLLAWPVEQLQLAFGWSDTQTGWVLLLVLGLLAMGAAGRRRASVHATPATAQRRVGRAPAPEPKAAGERRAVQTGRASGARPVDHIPGVRPGANAPATQALTPAGRSVGRARDPLPAQLRFSILQRDGFRCRYCGRTGGDPGVVLHVDHIVPLAAGGATREDNLRTACEECNLGKAASVVAKGP